MNESVNQFVNVNAWDKVAQRLVYKTHDSK